MRRESPHLEGEDMIVKQESVVGFTIYNIETSVCRFGGAIDTISAGSPWCQ
jgi:hypothetical protein